MSFGGGWGGSRGGRDSGPSRDNYRREGDDNRWNQRGYQADKRPGRFNEGARSSYSSSFAGSNANESYNRGGNIRHHEPSHFGSRGGDRGGDRGGFGGDRGGGDGHDFSSLRDVDFSTIKDSVGIEKNFYRETEKTSSRTADEVRAWRQSNEVELDDEACAIKPIMDFNELDVPGVLTDIFRKQNFQTPTPIQAQSWPIALRGQDTIGIARTGSGKTLGFLLPALVHIRAQAPLRRGDGPLCVVMLPTRELAQQVEEEAKKFGAAMRVRSCAVYGGAPRMQQKRDLESGAEIVVGCPGRLLDFIQSGVVNMRRVSFLILDEADRMLDMGFEPQIRKICGQMRRERQTLMYSATWPKEVRRLAEDFLNMPRMIMIGSNGDELVANKNIKQIVEVVEEWDKPARFTQFMEKAYAGKVIKSIVFTDTKRACDYLAQELGKRGWPVAPIHGDKDQRQRDSVLRDFRAGRIPILIATDVAARGIDVADIEYVINYDFPQTIEDYVHRIGRTARGEKSGTAFSLMTKEHSRCVRQLIEVMERSEQEVPNAIRELANSSRAFAGARARSRRDFGGGRGGGSRGGGRGGGRGGSGGGRFRPY